jgi:hypothetical protein
MTEEDRVQYKFMIPASLKARLEDAAHSHRRSLSAEIIHRLQTTFEMDDYQPGENAHPDEGDVRDVIEEALSALARMKARFPQLYGHGRSQNSKVVAQPAEEDPDHAAQSDIWGSISEVQALIMDEDSPSKRRALVKRLDELMKSIPSHG